MKPAAALALVLVTELAAWRLVAPWRVCRGSRRIALLVALVATGAALTLATELLSLFHALSALPVRVVWAVAAAALVALVVRRHGLSGVSPRLSGRPDAHVLVVAASAAVLAVVALTALVAPPNTWDAMSYHLPRVMHWIQDRSLAPFATHVPQQLKAPPGAEFVVLHLILLSGDDRLVGLVQWAALCAAAVSASVVAKLLGGNRTAQVVAAAFVVALPMAVVEASGAKNDVVVAAWVLCCASFVLVFRAERSVPAAVLVGLSAGLAILTKETAYFFVAPLLLWFVLLAVPRRTWAVGVAALAVLVLNAGAYVRGVVTFGSPLGTSSERTSQGTFDYANGTFGPRAFASNVVRDAALQLVPPWSSGVRAVESAVADVHRVLGISENDSRTTWYGQTFSLPEPSTQLFEDQVPNTVPFLLVLASGVAFLLRYRRFDAAARSYVACVLGGALLFCLVLRWQPWHSRLETPLFALAAPFVGVVAARIAGRGRALAAALLLLAAVLPWLLLGKPRTLVGAHSILSTGRTSQYFANYPAARQPFTRASDALAGRSCRDVGLITDADAFEYPLWPLLRSAGDSHVRIEDVDVHNATSSNSLPRGWKPCAVVLVEPLAGRLPVGSTVRVGSTTLRQAWAERPVRLFLPEPAS